MYSKDEKIYLEKLGSQIRKLRISFGMSQEKLSFESDLDRTYIGSVERGERNIAVINLKKISKALHVSVSELFNFDNE